MPASKPPTARQLKYLRTLATRAGQTFATPRDREHASAEIRRLKAITTTGFTFAELQAERAARAANDDVPLTIAYQPHELQGHGSTATWSRRP